MRKLLFPLLCLSLIFNSCEEDDSTTSASPSPSSTPCGSATFTANSTNYTLNNPQMMVPGECLVMSQVQGTNGDYSSVQVSMTNMYSNDFDVCPGVLDSDLDRNSNNSINAMIRFNVRNKVIHIKAGQPLIQLIPFKRTNWKLKHEKFDKHFKAVLIISLSSFFSSFDPIISKPT